jgi:hypothetical protein
MAIKISLKFYIARAQLRLDRGEKKKRNGRGNTGLIYYVSITTRVMN